MKEFNYDMINRYLDAEMTAEEQHTFELQMQQDPDLRTEVVLIKDVNATLKIKLHPAENELALRNTLKEMKAEYFETRGAKAKIIPLSQRRWMTAIAAMFIMALLLTIWQPWKREDLYQQYAAIQMPGIAERGPAADSLLKSAVENFNNKKFAEAIPVFETVLNNSIRDSAGVKNRFIQYYYAIALLQNDEVKKSRSQLEDLIYSASIFRNDATYYMALSYLKEKNTAACKEWLNKIPTDTEAWFKAQKLKQKL